MSPSPRARRARTGTARQLICLRLGWRTIVLSIVLLAVLLPTPRAASQIAPPAPSAAPALPRALQFLPIAQQQGLSNHSVWSIEQDHTGQMWFATLDGLNRYDGYTFEVFRADPDDPHSITSGITQALHQDSTGLLWIGTLTDGLNRFDPRSEQFTHWMHDAQDPGSISSDAVRAILEDRTGVLWLGTAAGLNRFDRESGTFTRFQHDPLIPRAWRTTTCTPYSKTSRACCGWRRMRRPRRLRPTNRHFTHHRHDPDDPAV